MMYNLLKAIFSVGGRDMTFRKVIKSIGSALMYFGIYMAWQFAVAFIAAFAVMMAMAVGAGVDMAAQMAQSGTQYSYDEVFEAAMELEMSIAEDASAWLLEHTVLLTLIAGVLTLATYALIFALRKKNIFREVGLAKMPVLPCFGMVILGAALNLAVSYVLTLVPFPEAWWTEQAAQSELLLGAEPWLTILLSVILAPILEEVVFRGLVHSRLKRSMPMLASMIISAWLFGLMHVSIIAVIYASLLGFLLAWVMEKYKSLLAPMLVHFGFNLCAVVLDMFEDIPTLVCIAARAVSVIGIVVVQMRSKNKIEFAFAKDVPSQDENQ